VRDHRERDAGLAAKPRPDASERECREEMDGVDVPATRSFDDLLLDGARRSQIRAGEPNDLVGESGRDRLLALTRRCEHHDVVRVEPFAQVRQVRLDPADLRWEVVGDEEVTQD
jgi:hypothetical protein